MKLKIAVVVAVLAVSASAFSQEDWRRSPWLEQACENVRSLHEQDRDEQREADRRADRDRERQIRVESEERMRRMLQEQRREQERQIQEIVQRSRR